MKRRGLPLASDVSTSDLSSMTTGFTGADLANLVNEAALLAGRANKDKVGRERGMEGGQGEEWEWVGQPMGLKLQSTIDHQLPGVPRGFRGGCPTLCGRRREEALHTPGCGEGGRGQA